MNLVKIEKTIEKALFNIIQRAVTKAPYELIKILDDFIKDETSSISISQLELIKENFEYGEKCEIPICQDTGVLNFFIELGTQFPIITNFRDLIENAVEKATKLIPLRGNSVDPLTNINPENNLGINVPPIYLDLVDKADHLKITVLAKGGGAENISKLFMLNPSEGVEIFQEKIIKTIKEARGMPCPPIILGIAIGGDASSCMRLAKKSLLKPLNQRNNRKDIALLEEELIENINNLNIGPMGLGGKFSCLDVHIEIAMRHPACFPVGLIVQCYSHRIASFVMNKEGNIIENS